MEKDIRVDLRSRKFYHQRVHSEDFRMFKMVPDLKFYPGLSMLWRQLSNSTHTTYRMQTRNYWRTFDVQTIADTCNGNQILWDTKNTQMRVSSFVLLVFTWGFCAQSCVSDCWYMCAENSLRKLLQDTAPEMGCESHRTQTVRLKLLIAQLWVNICSTQAMKINAFVCMQLKLCCCVFVSYKHQYETRSSARSAEF